MSKKILIVDDDNYILLITKTMLKHSGFETEAVTNGEDAISLISDCDNNISCIILDLTMPGLSGEDTLKQIRTINKEVPILISSGYMEDEIKDKFNREDISGFLKKPFQAKGLIDSVNSILGVDN